jgi:hypothetical protein
MSFFKRLTGASKDPAPTAEEGSAVESDLPIARFDHTSDKELTDQLSGLSQTQLAEVEEYERSHKERPAVLAKLRYLRTSEPLPGYDTLANDEIFAALEGADGETIKAVRDYEKKFQRRRAVLDETARLLPESEPSEKEASAQQAKDDRVASKMRQPK